MSDNDIMKNALVQYFGENNLLDIETRLGRSDFERKYIKITPLIRINKRLPAKGINTEIPRLANPYFSTNFPLVGNENVVKRSLNNNTSTLRVVYKNPQNKINEKSYYEWPEFIENVLEANNITPKLYKKSEYNNNLYVEVNDKLYNALKYEAKTTVNGIIESMGGENPPTGGKARKTRSKKSRKIRVKKYRKSKQVRIKKFKKTNKNKKITKRFRKTNKSRKVRR